MDRVSETQRQVGKNKLAKLAILKLNDRIRLFIKWQIRPFVAEVSLVLVSIMQQSDNNHCGMGGAR